MGGQGIREVVEHAPLLQPQRLHRGQHPLHEAVAVRVEKGSGVNGTVQCSNRI